MGDDWWLYIIRCADNSLYTGISSDVEKRFEQHCAGGARSAKYLRGRGPLKLVFKNRVGEKGLALKVELAVKKLNKKDKEGMILAEKMFCKILNSLE